MELDALQEPKRVEVGDTGLVLMMRPIPLRMMFVSKDTEMDVMRQALVDAVTDWNLTKDGEPVTLDVMLLPSTMFTDILQSWQEAFTGVDKNLESKPKSSDGVKAKAKRQRS